MDIPSLRIFREVVREGSFTRAAEKLHFVQSNVTARIQVMEKELKTSLFLRSKSGASLTAKGKILYDYSERILALTEEAERALSESGIPEGPLEIGSGQTTASVRLPSILSKYHLKFPKVRLSLRQGNTEDLVRAVLENQLDGAFVYEGFPHSQFLETPAFQENLVIVAPNTMKRNEVVSSWKQLSILTFKSGCTFRNRLDQWIQEQSLPPGKRIEFDSLDAILSCVISGMGISLLPESYLNERRQKKFVTILPLSSKLRKIRTVFIRNRELKSGNSLNEFVRMFEK
ncbi:LysR family transcriptional regulator [Leptospira stimsonii]|uniref:LysR family transcriptional regulator n=1 Tax=Leptospira stimsonii TaxID=2202203 RepID=A0A4V3JUV1_9LEPT|nr:LysR family transcriptional regulator [Leptospira stimsonii]RHX88872.1 LysR family transcriptional regulator [Leptospira stimsonii]TGK17812.1 LysR family transcriptional regulator [Leptospira stimsonii]TGM12654.1 LysR family transcriptional regulator [Leptospira stimsonii]